MNWGLKTVKDRHSDSLSRVAWARVETLLAVYYRQQGYDVDHVGTGATGRKFDGGIDLKLRKDDQYILVQCKHWNVYQVTHNAVHELLGVMVNESATGAILVTSGEFTRYAKESAEKLGHVQLIDGHALRAMLGPLPEIEPLPALRMDNRQPMARSRKGSKSGGGSLAAKVVGIVFAIGVFWIGRQYVETSLQKTLRDLPGRTSSQPAAVIPASKPPAAQHAGQPLSPFRTAGHIVAADAAALTGDQEAMRAHMQGLQNDIAKSMKLPDPQRRIDHEAARAAARQVDGVRSIAWVDRENLLAIVDGSDRRSDQTISAICAALEPLGDTLGVVVSLQNGRAKNGAELEIMSRNCQLAPGDRALLQAKRQMDVLPAEARAQYEAGRKRSDAEDKKRQEENMRILERTTPQL